MNENPIPIIAIDGTSSSGKGTIAYRLAQHFGYNYLNSGALYRLTAYTAITSGIELTDKESLIKVAQTLTPHFSGKQVLVNGVDIWPIISTQEYGNHASVISPIKELRAALFSLQRNMIKAPGLVTEGRDMCTVVFTDAKVKLYLDATVEERAKRRFKDENAIKSGKTYEGIVEELKVRDERDKTREEGALYPSDDAKIIDTTNMNIQEVLDVCIAWCKEKGLEK